MIQMTTPEQLAKIDAQCREEKAIRRSKQRGQDLYFASVSPGNFVKIGRSQHPLKRLKQLERQYPGRRFRLVGVIKSIGRAEVEIHSKFRLLSEPGMGREIYRNTSEVRKFVASILGENQIQVIKNLARDDEFQFVTHIAAPMRKNQKQPSRCLCGIKASAGTILIENPIATTCVKCTRAFRLVNS